MGCMKCGKKLGESQMFCDECLEKMAQCPVPANAVVNLPKRHSAPPVKKKQPHRRYFWNIEGENDTLRSKLRWMRFALTIATLGLIFALAVIILLLYTQGRLDFIKQLFF